MARPLGLKLAGGLYHVTSRGASREAIYEDDEDREKWLETFGNTCQRFLLADNGRLIQLIF